MEFLAPNLLWSLPLAGLPLLLYWWRRQQAEQMDYPSLSWINDELRDTLRQTRQQRWLQVLWRIFLILLMIYTLSQPIIGQGRSTPDRMVVFFDNSLSMEQSNVGQTALQKSKEWLRSKWGETFEDETTRVGVMLPEPRLLNATEPGIDSTLERVSSRPGSPTLGQLRTWARNNLEGNTRIILLTDAQTSLFEGDRGQNQPSLVELQIPFTEPENHSLTDVTIRPYPQFVGQSSTVVSQTRTGGGEVKRIIVGDSEQIVAGPDRSVSWQPTETGMRRVRVELGSDGLSWDNTWRTVAEVREQLRVYVLGESDAIQSVLYTLGDHVTRTNRLASADLVMVGTGGFDEAKLNDLSIRRLRQLPKWIVAGQSFDRASFGQLDTRLSIPWDIEGLVERSSDGIPRLGDEAWFRPLIESPATLLDQLTIRSIYRTQSPDEARALVTLDESAVLSTVENWYLLTVPPEQFLSPETASAAWPRLLLTVTRGMVQQPQPEEWTVGEPVSIEDRLEFPVSIRGTGEESIELENADARWVPPEPGFYRLSGSGGWTQLRAANHDPSEGDLTRLDRSEWPASVVPYEERNPGINLTLAPWLWLLLMGGICLDVWWATRSD
jgi:hypothetical protein